MTEKKTDITSSSLDNDTQSSSEKNRSEKAIDKLSDEITAAKRTTTQANQANVKKAVKASSPLTGNTATPNQSSLSKTAVVALLIALMSTAGVVGIHYLHTQERNKQKDTLIQQLTTLSSQNEARVKQLMLEQQSVVNQHINEALSTLKSESETRITQLESQLQTLKKNQPSDWLIHEAEYLVRIASRTIWLEHDTVAAMQLLADADDRIKELNDPQFLPIRQIIREDIATLKLTPELKTEEIIMSLMALDKQVSKLSLAMVDIPEAKDADNDLTLTNNPADWKTNLAKTWQRFLADFITIRKREGAVEPLMSPQYQQHLFENLSLKLQQAQWAVSQENSTLYKNIIADIQQWLTQYFDMGHLETAQFYQGIHALKDELISYDYPQNLQALKAIRQVITNQKNERQVEKLTNEVEASPEAKDVETTTPDSIIKSNKSVKESPAETPNTTHVSEDA